MDSRGISRSEADRQVMKGLASCCTPKIFSFFFISHLYVRRTEAFLNSAFRLNTCETHICQVDFLKKAEVSSTIKIGLFFIQRLTPAVLLVLSSISLSADLNFSSPLRVSAETWYKCKAKRIWDWSEMHFFGQRNSCCLPFTGSQNHSGALPKSQCLDNTGSVCERVCIHPLLCECVYVHSLQLVSVWVCACVISLPCMHKYVYASLLFEWLLWYKWRELLSVAAPVVWFNDLKLMNENEQAIDHWRFAEFLNHCLNDCVAIMFKSISRVIQSRYTVAHFMQQRVSLLLLALLTSFWLTSMDLFELTDLHAKSCHLLLKEGLLCLCVNSYTSTLRKEISLLLKCFYLVSKWC